MEYNTKEQFEEDFKLYEKKQLPYDHPMGKTNDPYSLAGASLWKDEMFCRKAIVFDLCNLERIPDEMYENKNLAIYATYRWNDMLNNAYEGQSNFGDYLVDEENGIWYTDHVKGLCPLERLSENLTSDKEFMLEVAEITEGRSNRYVTGELCSDIDFVTRSTDAPLNIQFFSEEIKDNKEIALKAVEIGRNLQYLSDRLKDDNDVVSKAVLKDPRALQYASERMKDDKELILESFKSGPRDYDTGDDPFGNGEINYTRKQDPGALRYASDRLKDDPEVVLAGGQLSSDALYYASDRLKDDKDLVLEICKECNSFGYASERLRNDWDTCLAIYDEGKYGNYKQIPDNLKNDIDFVLYVTKYANYECEEEIGMDWDNKAPPITYCDDKLRTDYRDTHDGDYSKENMVKYLEAAKELKDNGCELDFNQNIYQLRDSVRLKNELDATLPNEEKSAKDKYLEDFARQNQANTSKTKTGAMKI